MTANDEAAATADGQPPLLLLRVKKLPGVLSADALTALLSHYGAASVRLLKCPKDVLTTTKKKHQTAIASFASEKALLKAQEKLNRLELAGSMLVAEKIAHASDEDAAVASAATIASHTTQPPLPPSPTIPTAVSTINKTEVAPTSHSYYAPLAPHLGLHYAPSPLLEYKYPKATEAIVRNIANALIALPKFYTQVLHLMNKMNLPTPFEENAIPGMFSKMLDEQDGQRSQRKRKLPNAMTQFVEEEDDDDDDDDEIVDATSMGSKENQPPVKKTKREKEEELETSTAQRNDASQLYHFTRNKPILKQLVSKSKTFTTSSSDLAKAFMMDCSTPPSVRPGVISEVELQRGHLQSGELMQEPLMATYHPGTLSPVLLVQNLAATLDEKDLLYVFGHVLPMEFELSAIDIQLSPSSHSATIHYPREELAKAALEKLHGFVLEGKPLIVSFQDSMHHANEPSANMTKSLAADTQHICIGNLLDHRLSPEELEKEKAMKNYERGVASTTLYVKNLAKSVQINDLRSIFGSVLPSTSSSETLNIRHFTEGRMKCQAFIEYPSITLAEDALEKIHGVVLKDKPLVVCFRKPSSNNASKMPSTMQN